MSRLRVYFNEYNVMSDNTVYLPLVSGVLQAHAQNNPLIAQKYDFQNFLFRRDRLESIVNQYKNPDVAAFSASMWNVKLSLAVAEFIKRRYPQCLIVFGGCEIPFEAQKFFERYPFVDVCARGEGEKTFEDILLKFPDKAAFSQIPGISFLDENGRYVTTAERELEKNLDKFPSPYLQGVFDRLISENPEIKFQAIIETNRGCPYGCTYCSWGQGGLSKKFRFFGMERIKGLAEWCGKKEIDYVFCADSNFGMFKRDLEIARFFVESKLRNNGHPEKFRVCYAKNAEETVFEIGKLLHEHDMEKGVTLSRQSNNPEVLANVGRKNIRMEVFNTLQKRYNQAGIPTYTELILGLPGESYRSFADGLEELLKSGIQNQLFVYPCQVYPNTELGDKDYQKKFGIRTRRIPLNEVHGTIRGKGIVTEYEDLIVGTDSMPESDWRRAIVLSSTMQLLHGLKAGFYLMNYLADSYGTGHVDFLEYIAEENDNLSFLGRQINTFRNSADSVLSGNSRCRVMPEFGNIYWEPEEASFFEVAGNKPRFYSELNDIARRFLIQRGIKFDERQLDEIIFYQGARMPSYYPESQTEFSFNFNIPEYFENLALGRKAVLERKPQKMRLTITERRDKKDFAINSVLRGRKSNKILYPVAEIK